MIKNTKEIEDWLKIFYQRQYKNIKENDFWEMDFEISNEFSILIRNAHENTPYFTIHIQEEVLDLLPEWEDGWAKSWFIGDDKVAKMEFGVGSFDDLDDKVFGKNFYFLNREEYEWWVSLGDSLKDTSWSFFCAEYNKSYDEGIRINSRDFNSLIL